MKKICGLILLIVSFFVGIESIEANECNIDVAKQVAKIVYRELGSDNYAVDGSLTFFGRMTTASIILNNASSKSGSTWLAKVKNLTDSNYESYSSYKNSSFESVEPANKRGEMLYIAALVLSGKYNLPKNMIFQCAGYIIRQYGGVVWTKIDSPYYDVYFGSSGALTTTDVFGRQVANSSVIYFKNLANSLKQSDYSKYNSNNVCDLVSGVTGSGGTTCWECDNGKNIYKYFYQVSEPMPSCKTTSDSSAACTAKNTHRVKFNVTKGGRIIGSDTQSCTLTTGFSCEVPAPTAVLDGYTFGGWSTNSSCNSNIGHKASTIWLTGDIDYFSCWIPNGPTAKDYNPDSYDEKQDSSDKTATTREFYTITYDLNGGRFLDNTTSRKQIITSDKIVGGLKAPPVKDGYKLKEWQVDGKTYTFNQHPTGNITVNAIWEELTDKDKEYY